MATIRNATGWANGSNNSPQTITIPATAAGSTLVVVVGSDTAITGCSATGATFGAARLSIASRLYVFSAYNVSASITTISYTYSGYAGQSGWVFEVSSARTATDSYDTGNTYDCGYNGTNLGTGAITTAADGAGLCIAAFVDYYGGFTAYSNGSGWTAGTTANHNYYEYRTSANSTGYGGTSGQATATAGSGQVYGCIVNIMDAGGGGGGAVSPVPFRFTLVGVQ